MKRIVGILWIVVFTFILLSSSSFKYVVDEPLGTCLTLILWIMYGGMISFLMFRKYPVVLTEEERLVPVADYQDFSNESRWADYFGALLFLLLMLVLETSSKVIRTYVETQSWEMVLEQQEKIWTRMIGSATFLGFLVVVTVVFFVQIFRTGKNKYVINEDVLIVQENTMTRKEEEIRIPIETIDEVYIQFKYAVYPSLYIKVNGIKRRFYATTHALELGKAILQHKAVH